MTDGGGRRTRAPGGNEPIADGGSPAVGPGVSRRNMLAAASAAGVLSASAARAQAPAGARDPSAGRPFRGFVFHPSMGGETVDLRLLPLGPRDVLVRSEASITTYTMTRTAFRQPPAGSGLGVPANPRHTVIGQGCVGVVEQIGTMVKRFKVGDRAVLCGNPQCGQCYQCLNGRAEWCQVLSEEPRPFAVMRDGTPVYPRNGVGGLSELVVATEEWGLPIFTDLPAIEMAMANSTASYGLGAAFNQAPVTPGADVVVLGCGPVGLGAVQGARIRGAGQIIAVEPIAYRRDLARKFGATAVLDPNALGDALVEMIRDMCKGPTDRIFAGGRSWTNAVNVPRGADFTIEAVGAEMHLPKAERGPDPTGILPLRQAWEVTRAGGNVSLMGGSQLGDVSFPGFEFANRGRTVHPVQTGLQVMRDIPRIITLVERGHFDVKSMCTTTFPIERAIESLQAVADRTTIGSFLVFG
jgi:S-(hydroxymethyl)glutathione dehydrogenase/alcohol dehydrogenase